MDKEPKLTIKALKAEMEEKFNAFNEVLDERFANISSALEVLVNKDKKIGETPEAVKAIKKTDTLPENVEVKIEEGGPQTKEIANVQLKPEYKAVFDKYFDETDGFIGSYDELNSMFTVEVPLTLSNMVDASQKFYGKDLRSKRVDQNDILGSIDNWCEKVAKNLKYNRKINLKI